MLFHSSLRKELARSFVATLVVLITVVMSMMLIRTLGLASSGIVNPKDVMLLMGYAVLGHLSTILTLSLFIAVTSTLGRMYRDSEMAIWFSSGRSLASFCVPVLRFAWPILLSIVLLALFVWPWSNQQAQRMRDSFENRGELDRVAAGQFQENASGTRVFFIERDDSFARNAQASAASASASATASTSADQIANTTPTSTTDTSAEPADASATQKTARNVFMLSTEAGKTAVTSARSGRIERINGEQFLLLNNGQRMEQTAGQDAVRTSEFAEYGTQLGRKVAGPDDAPPPRTLRTNQLLRAPTLANLAELSWRVGLALAGFNLVLLALVLSASNPRAGRGYSLVFALLAFVAYYNLLNAGFGWVSSGRVGFSTYMLSLHGGVLAATCLLMAARSSNWSVRYLLPARV